jgi:hypothetical protein
MRRPGAVVAVAAIVLTAPGARAHSLAPEEVVAGLTLPAARVALGVEQAIVDERNPRVLVVRVGDGWFHLAAPIRSAAAEEWQTTWRHAVPAGVVAVLDARTGAPVVRYGTAGRVTGITDHP